MGYSQADQKPTPRLVLPAVEAMGGDFLKLMTEIERKRDELSCSRSGAFFRGHSNGTYKLIPSLLRRELHPDTEHNLFHECFARANHMIGREATAWERLAFFQHHGIPTRLLDWTESLGVALFFAVRENPNRPHLWIVNAFRLNRSNGATTKPRILMASLDAIPDYHECYIRIGNRQQWPYKKPIFLQIPWTTDRLRAQSGYFTFHPTPDSIDSICPKYFRRVEIEEEAIPGVLRFLDLAGITEHTVFPDFVGLAGFLRRRYHL
jgi:FRG domain